MRAPLTSSLIIVCAMLFLDSDHIADHRLAVAVGPMAQTNSGSTTAAVTPHQFLRSGESFEVDAGPAIRRALASGAPVRFPAGTYIVQPDPASYRGGHHNWSIRVPSGAVLFFDRGALIRAANGTSSWNRIVTFEGASNVKSYGELSVDANVQGASPVSNEHMHGVFLYNTRDSYFERIKSINARGDNVYIGGTDETKGSNGVRIGSIYAETAGRKNLVIQASDDLWIENAVLDNRRGGAHLFGGVADDTDGNSFDVEPDAFTGNVRNSARVDRLVTYGAGNDFTAGTAAASADNWVLTIGQFDSFITPRENVAPWTQYGITLNIGRLHIRGISALESQSTLFYSARLRADEVTIEGRRPGDFLLLVASIGRDLPVVQIGTLTLRNPGGHGLESRDAHVQIRLYEAFTGRIALWNRGLSGAPGVAARMRIDELRLDNVGQPDRESYAVLANAQSNPASLYIGRILHKDTRAVSIRRLIEVDRKKVDLTVGAYNSSTRVPLLLH